MARCQKKVPVGPPGGGRPCSAACCAVAVVGASSMSATVAVRAESLAISAKAVVDMRYNLGRIYIRHGLTHEEYTRRTQEGSL